MQEISFRNDILPLKDKLFRLALRITLDRAEAEDVVQDTMIRVWSKRDEWSQFESVEAYCLIVAKNLAIDRSQKKEAQNVELTPDGDVAVFRTVAVTLPVVKMNEITNVTPSSAKLYGTVTSAGSGIIHRKGFCWSNTQTSPLLGQDASCEVSTGEDAYSYALTGLSGKTKYYVRAYAENEKGISYSETAEFQTGSAAVIPTLGGTTVSEIGETSAKAVATVVSDGEIGRAHV